MKLWFSEHSVTKTLSHSCPINDACFMFLCVADGQQARLFILGKRTKKPGNHSITVFVSRLRVLGRPIVQSNFCKVTSQHGKFPWCIKINIWFLLSYSLMNSGHISDECRFWTVCWKNKPLVWKTRRKLFYYACEALVVCTHNLASDLRSYNICQRCYIKVALFSEGYVELKKYCKGGDLYI